MRLRFVEREILTPVDCMTPNIVKREVIRVLQYWNPINDWEEDGNWIDVPLEVEE